MGSRVKRDSIAKLDREVIACAACPRLVAWREEVGAKRKAAFRDFEYWAKPVPSLGGGDAGLLVLGLAPGAHGANRTGRPFTGDGAGPFLYEGLYDAGFSNQPTSVGRDDGLELVDARITNAVRCVPPANLPKPAETDECFPFLVRELELMKNVRVILCLGGLAWNVALRLYRELGIPVARPKPKFGHAAEYDPGDGAPVMLASFHPSQLNTYTGRLTRPMFAKVMRRARALIDA